jgi:exportin-1
MQRHLAYLESVPGEHEVMRAGLEMLISISYVDDTEVFKSCLDYWQLFVAEIFSSCTAHALPGEWRGALPVAGLLSAFQQLSVWA